MLLGEQRDVRVVVQPLHDGLDGQAVFTVLTVPAEDLLHPGRRLRVFGDLAAGQVATSDLAFDRDAGEAEGERAMDLLLVQEAFVSGADLLAGHGDRELVDHAVHLQEHLPALLSDNAGALRGRI